MRQARRLARVVSRIPAACSRPVHLVRPASTTQHGSVLKRTRKKRDTVVELTLDLGGPEPPASPDQAERSSAQAKTIEDQVRQAILEHRIPNTELGCSVYRNVLRFPDCIVLTRVGKFYESYFDQALRLAGLVDIKLAMKMHRVVPRSEADAILEGDSAVRKPKPSDPQRLFPFAGFPVFQVEKYLQILVQDLGHTVVLVEETDDELATQSIKVRKVGRVVTPGTLVDASWLNGDESRYLLAISVSDQPVKVQTEDGEWTLGLWLAYTDVSTGEFFSKETTLAQLEDELARISPREVVLDKSFKALWSAQGSLSATDTAVSSQELMSLLRLCGAHVSFADTFRTPYLEGRDAVELSPEDLVSLEARSISLLRHHLQFALREFSPDLSNPDRQVESAYMHIDAATLNALEIRHSLRSGEVTRANPVSAKGTLLSVLNRTVTSSGHRLLVRTLSAPLTSVEKIRHRQDLVQAFVDREDLRDELRSVLRPLKDMMRLVQRFKTHRGNADDIWETSVWIRGIQRICRRIQMEIDHELKRVSDLGLQADPGVTRLQILLDSLRPLGYMADEIERTVNGQLVRASRRPSTQSLAIDDDDDSDGDGKMSLLEDRDTMPEPLEEIEFPEGMTMTNRGTMQTYRNYEIAETQQYWINAEEYPKLKALKKKLDKIDRQKIAIQNDLRAKFGVAEKELVLLGNNERIGYHLHLSKPADRVKALGDERFKVIPMTTKNIEDTVWSDLGRQRDQIVSDLLTEQGKVARALRQQIIDASDDFQHNCGLVDELDMCMGFAQTAVEMHYTRPTVTTGIEFKVVNGRHPAVEAALHSTARLFVPNTTDMTSDSHLHIITGPNQGGKSTFLRQTAVIAILAQSGSFVPADEATIGVVDKVFSRIGARDDLFRDRSTFMLEMVETAAILRYATQKSLVIMDEIGRGTTLQAGMAIAYATLDYILERIKCRTLFATHYHELEGMLVSSSTNGADEPKVAREGIEFWCTDVDEADGALSYSYRLKQGINRNSHAILAARLAGMPQGFLKVANDKLEILTMEKEQAERRKAEDARRDNGEHLHT